MKTTAVDVEAEQSWMIRTATREVEVAAYREALAAWEDRYTSVDTSHEMDIARLDSKDDSNHSNHMAYRHNRRGWYLTLTLIPGVHRRRVVRRKKGGFVASDDALPYGRRVG